MASIQDIQSEYFNLIDSYFRDEINKLMNSPDDRLSDSIDILKSKSIITHTYPTTKTILDNKFEIYLLDLSSFWEKYEETITSYVNSCGLNSITLWANEPIIELAPKFLLYYDLVLLLDPLTSLANNVIKLGFYRDVFIYFFIIYKLRDLQSSNTDYPLVLIVPYKKGIEGYKILDNESDLANEFLKSDSGRIAIDAFNAATNFNQDFKNAYELFELLQSSSISALNRNINLPLIHKLLQFLIDDPKLFQASNKSGMLDFILSNRLQFRIATAKDFFDLFMVINSIFAVCDAREFNAIRLNSTNLITSIHLPFAEFKYEQITKSFGSILEISDEHLINYTINQKFTWLDHIDINTCRELRENGNLENFRRILRIESDKIKNVSFIEFPKIASEFESNVLKELSLEHNQVQRDIMEIKNKRKITLASFAVTTALTFSSLAFPALLPLTIISTAYGMSAGASIKDIVNDVLFGRGKLKELNKRPISIIMASKKKGK